MSDNGHIMPTVELDMTRGRDREYLRRAVTRGWPIDPDDMRRYYDMLKWASQKAMSDGDAREVNACVRTMVVIVGQRQSDEQLAERIASGVSTPPETTIHIDARRVMIEQTDLDALERVRQRLNGSLGGHSTE